MFSYFIAVKDIDREFLTGTLARRLLVIKKRSSAHGAPCTVCDTRVCHTLCHKFTKLVTPNIFFSIQNQMANFSIDDVDAVDIDATGTFKYVLIELTDKSGKTRQIVCGHAWAVSFRIFIFAKMKQIFLLHTQGFHADIFEDVEQRLKAKGVRCECLGGGRIKRSSKTIVVYGYSVGFGAADHSLTCDILRERYQGDFSISFHNDGY